MRPDFYGRAAALHELHTLLTAVRQSGTGRLLALDGRRHVGTSRLATEFAERAQVPYLYYTAGSDESPARHLRALAESASLSTRPLPYAETLFAEPPHDWPDAFGRLAEACRDRPTIVVLDDFDEATNARPELPALLASHWRRQLRACPLLFIVVTRGTRTPATSGASGTSGSGRAAQLVPDATLTLAPFNPAECAHALGPRTTAMAAFDTYLITGGNPRLVAGVAQVGDPQAFVHQQLADDNSDLVVMGQRLVAREVAESASARLVLGAIGSEPLPFTSFSRIVAQLPTTGVTAQTAATRALKLLTDRHVVAAHTPVGAAANTKLRRYRVEDFSLRFWHFFAQPHLADIARGRADIAIAGFNAGWPAWRQAAMHPVVHDASRRLSLTMPEFTRADVIGGWWNREGHQADLVISAKRNQPVVAVGAVRWRVDEPFTAADRQGLEVARAAVPGGDRARSVAVCPAGAARNSGVDIVIDADTLLGAW